MVSQMRVHFDQYNSTTFRSSKETCIEKVQLLDQKILSITFVKKLSIRNIILLKIYDQLKTVEAFLSEKEVDSKYIFKHNLPLDLYQMLYKTSSRTVNKSSTLLIEFIIKPSDITAIGSITDYRKLSLSQKIKYLSATTATDHISIDLSKCNIKEEFNYGISIECFDFDLQLQYNAEINSFIVCNPITKLGNRTFALKEHLENTEDSLTTTSEFSITNDSEMTSSVGHCSFSSEMVDLINKDSSDFEEMVNNDLNRSQPVENLNLLESEEGQGVSFCCPRKIITEIENNSSQDNKMQQQEMSTVVNENNQVKPQSECNSTEMSLEPEFDQFSNRNNDTVIKIENNEEEIDHSAISHIIEIPSCEEIVVSNTIINEPETINVDLLRHENKTPINESTDLNAETNHKGMNPKTEALLRRLKERNATIINKPKKQAVKPLSLFDDDSEEIQHNHVFDPSIPVLQGPPLSKRTFYNQIIFPGYLKFCTFLKVVAITYIIAYIVSYKVREDSFAIFEKNVDYTIAKGRGFYENFYKPGPINIYNKIKSKINSIKLIKSPFYNQQTPKRINIEKIIDFVSKKPEILQPYLDKVREIHAKKKRIRFRRHFKSKKRSSKPKKHEKTFYIDMEIPEPKINSNKIDKVGISVVKNTEMLPSIESNLIENIPSVPEMKETGITNQIMIKTDEIENYSKIKNDVNEKVMVKPESYEKIEKINIKEQKEKYFPKPLKIFGFIFIPIVIVYGIIKDVKKIKFLESHGYYDPID
ncbi:hypothetical protein NUSPORA_00611 [Nucleospora cyclopteri]